MKLKELVERIAILEVQEKKRELIAWIIVFVLLLAVFIGVLFIK